MKYLKCSSRPLSNVSRQDGWTMWSMMITIGLIVLFAYIGLKLFPLYTGNSAVKNAMERSIEDISPNEISRAKIIKKIRDQLYLDGSVDGLLDFKKDLKVTRSQRELTLKINYERRIELFFNLSIVATFENEAKSDL